MLTRKSYKFLGHHFLFARLLLAMPFRWDPETERLSCTTSRLELFFWLYNQLFSIAMTSWIIRSFVLGVMNNDRDVAKLSVDAMYIMPYAAQVLFSVQLLFSREEMADFLNALMTLDKKYTRKYCVNVGEEEVVESKLVKIGKKPKPKEEPTDGCDKNIFLSTYMMFVYAGLSVSMFLKSPDDARYLYSALPYPWGEKPEWFFYSWAVMEYLQLIKFCCIFNNAFDFILLYAHCTNFWLFELSNPGQDASKEDTVRTLVRPVLKSEVVVNYKAQIILNNLFNKCSAGLLLPTFQCLNIGLHIVATYVSIKYYSAMPIGGYLIFPIGFIMWCAIEKDTYPLLGKIQYLSDDFKTSWKPVLGNEATRQIRALKTLGVQVSGVYIVSRDTVLHVWSTVLNQVVNLILL